MRLLKLLFVFIAIAVRLAVLPYQTAGDDTGVIDTNGFTVETVEMTATQIMPAVRAVPAPRPTVSTALTQVSLIPNPSCLITGYCFHSFEFSKGPIRPDRHRET